jgi:glycosyltransferase involved in cell wall biosynthesis
VKLSIRFPLRPNIDASGHILGYDSFRRHLTDALVMAGVEAVEDGPVALHISPPHMAQFEAGQWSVLFSMWEARDLPPSMARCVAPADMLIVPSTFCKAVFRRAGFTKPIAVVPLGLWPHDWPDPPPARTHGGPRRFLWLGSRDPRKGWTFMRDAWQQAMVDDSRATLTVKTSSDPGETRMANLMAGNVAFLTHKMPWDELRSLYLSHDVYVNTSVGEGYGLIPLEAMAAGLLVISPRHTGMADFLHAGNAWLMPTQPVKAHYGVPTVVQAPKLSALKALLRHAVETPWVQTEALRQRAAQEARRLSWQHTADGVIQALQRYAGGLVG